MNHPKAKNNWDDVTSWENRELALTIFSGSELYRYIGLKHNTILYVSYIVY